MTKLTSKEILESKGKRKITMTTALDYFTAKAVEEAEIDIIGVGGTPVEMAFKGAESGAAAKLEEVLFCLGAVRKGAPNTFIMCSLPYGYSFVSKEDTLRNAVKIMKSGADAAKIQGAGFKVKKIRQITREGIPCTGHIGLIPQFVSSIGGFRSVGKKAGEAIMVYQDALALQEAGVIWIELECVPYKVAREITKRINVPIISIGSGKYCDGQFLHSEDILGVHNRHYPKHCKKYRDLYNDSIGAFKEFKKEVESTIFPGNENSFKIEDKEFKIFPTSALFKLIISKIT